MRFQKTLHVTDCAQLIKNPPQCGQWIQLAWCDKPSRFHHVTGTHITAFHFPGAVSSFNSYNRLSKTADAFARFNRRARELSQRN